MTMTKRQKRIAKKVGMFLLENLCGIAFGVAFGLFFIGACQGWW